MRFPTQKALTYLFVLSVSTGCSGDFLADADSDESGPTNQQADQEDKDQDEIKVLHPDEVHGLACSTLVQERSPMGIRTTCQVPASQEKLVYVLDYVPLAEEDISVRIGDIEHSQVRFDAETNTLTITGLAEKDTQYELKISYDAEKKFNKLGSSALTFGFVKDATGLDGCKWLIESADGTTKFEPLNLPEEFQKDGTYIQFKYSTPETDVASICMAGSLVTLSDVKTAASSDDNDSQCDAVKPGPAYVCMLVSSGCYQGAAPDEDAPPPTSTWTWVKDGNLQCAPSAGGL